MREQQRRAQSACERGSVGSKSEQEADPGAMRAWNATTQPANWNHGQRSKTQASKRQGHLDSEAEAEAEAAAVAQRRLHHARHRRLRRNTHNEQK